MSEKRFEWDRTGIFDNKTNHFYYKTFDNEEVVDLLNDLSEENERLKKEVENLQSNMMESLGEHRKYEKSLEEENERKTNEIKLLRKQYSKIPKNIREVWK